jgi:hypothetical protein
LIESTREWIDGVVLSTVVEIFGIGLDQAVEIILPINKLKVLSGLIADKYLQRKIERAKRRRSILPNLIA